MRMSDKGMRSSPRPLSASSRRVAPLDVEMNALNRRHSVLDRRHNELDEQVLERARQRGLKLEWDTDRERLDDRDRRQQMEIIRGLPFSLRVKRALRDRMNENAGYHKKSVCGAFCYRQKLGCYRRKLACKLACAEFDAYTTLWGGAIKEVEGFHGTGVATYFTFLRWMFKLNIVIFLVMLLFVVLPQSFFTELGYTDGIVGDVVTEETRNLSANCSAQYDASVVTSGGVDVYVRNFFEGAGWMEQTALFVGFYSDREFSTSVLRSYNLPLAYLACTLVYFLISLVSILSQTSEGARARLLAGEQNKKTRHVELTLCGWDFALCDDQAVEIRQKALYREAVGTIAEERRRLQRLEMSGLQECRLWSARLLVNAFVLASLGGAGYLLYYVTEVSVQMISAADFSSRGSFEQLLIQYLVSLTITGLNALLPAVYSFIVRWEDYSPAFEVNITLIRTVFLKLASLIITLATLYSSITCAPKDECRVGTGDCNPIRCWETYVGQELYKLVVMDFLVLVASTFTVDFLRKFLVDDCESSRLVQSVGHQEFDIPRNVLDLIYGQMLLWLGTFFCPLLPAIFIVINFLTFYIKLLTLLVNYRPSEKPFRASDSHAFFMQVLLIGYVLCAVPLCYIAYWVAPSRGCGPFRVYDQLMDVGSVTVGNWPDWARDALTYLTSGLFLLVIITVLCLVIYFVTKMKNAYKRAGDVLRDELVMESQDKKFLKDMWTRRSDSAPPPGGVDAEAEENGSPLVVARSPPGSRKPRGPRDAEEATALPIKQQLDDEDEDLEPIF